MKTKCRFLEATQHGPACGIGVNFRSPGEDCALCETCPLRGLDHTAYCRHLEADAILGLAAGDRTVTVELGCALSDVGLEDLVECQGCPTFESMSPQSAEAIGKRRAFSCSSIGRP